MDGTRVPSPPPVSDTFMSSEFNHGQDFGFQPQGIAPVHLRDNGKVPTLNRGVYSSWDHDPLNASTTSINSSQGIFGIQNSMNLSRRSLKYESTDLLRILSEPDPHADSLSLFDNSFLMNDMDHEGIIHEEPSYLS